ncbi:MAG: hypothetical protein ACYC7E_17615 [Armatimonadota bacterium]
MKTLFPRPHGWLVCVFLPLFWLLLPAGAQQPPPAAGQKVSPFAGCKQPTIEIPKSLDDLPQSAFALPVTKAEGMFNPVFLPFAYKAEGVEADPNQPLTFPSLLKFKFEFVPDNFTMRSPAFIFQTQPPARKLTAGDTKIIPEFIKYWNATHAIGGELVESAQGFRGKMLVFDKTGAQVLTREYATPLPYFTLMGRMVQDWMAFRKQPVSEWLKTELERPMTTKMDTVRWYGQSFQVKWRTQPEWAIYQKILEADPYFGEVRYWYANQRSLEKCGTVT